MHVRRLLKCIHTDILIHTCIHRRVHAQYTLRHARHAQYMNGTHKEKNLLLHFHCYNVILIFFTIRAEGTV